MMKEDREKLESKVAGLGGAFKFTLIGAAIVTTLSYCSESCRQKRSAHLTQVDYPSRTSLSFHYNNTRDATHGLKQHLNMPASPMFYENKKSQEE